MAKGERSELTELVEEIADGMLEQFDALIEEWGQIPFLYEAIDRAEYRRRLLAMTPEQIRAEMRRIGTPEVLRNLRTGG